MCLMVISKLIAYYLEHVSVSCKLIAYYLEDVSVS